MKKLTYTLLLITISLSSHASSFEECGYKLKVESKTKLSIKVKILAYLGGTGAPGKEYCTKQLENNEIKVSNIEGGKELLQINSEVMATRSYYTGMGENGPISSILWKFVSTNK